MHDRVEQHFDVLREGGGRAAAARCSRRWATASRPRSRRPRPPCRRRSRRSGRCRRSASRCGWASTPARWSASVTTSAVAPVNRAARIMAVGHGGQILVSDVTAALVRIGPEPGRIRRPRHPSTARPHRTGTGVAGGPPRPASGTSRRCAGSTPTRTTCRRSVRRSSGRDADVARVIGLTQATSDRHPHRGGRRRQDPTRRAGRRRPAGRLRGGVVRRARQRRRPRRRRRRDRAHDGPGDRDRSAGRGGGDAVRRGHAAGGRQL